MKFSELSELEKIRVVARCIADLESDTNKLHSEVIRWYKTFETRPPAFDRFLKRKFRKKLESSDNDL